MASFLRYRRGHASTSPFRGVRSLGTDFLEDTRVFSSAWTITEANTRSMQRHVRDILTPIKAFLSTARFLPFKMTVMLLPLTRRSIVFYITFSAC